MPKMGKLYCKDFGRHNPKPRESKSEERRDAHERYEHNKKYTKTGKLRKSYLKRKVIEYERKHGRPSYRRSPVNMEGSYFDFD